MQRTEPPIVTRHRALMEWMGTRHGVAHTSLVRAAGFRPYDVAHAVRLDALRRVRRSWLVTIDCDRRRVAAARVGGRVTCVSAAAIQRLWVPKHGEIHVAVPGTASRFDADGLHVHWGTGPAPIGRGATEEHIVNVLFHVAHCLARRDALAVWESAIRNQAVETGVLMRVAWRSEDAAALAAVASFLSDSGLETHFVDGMRTAGVAVRQQVWIDGHAVDGLVGDSLIVQIDGFTHHRAAERRRDLAADARLVLRGYTVLRFDYYQVLFDWSSVLTTVLTAMAQNLHRQAVVQNS
ncbi:MAG: endonuclease domain-containing protein [Microbacterium sp.]|uniref:endonuclease domain-containing protein n=1 Tax=Microbacterium sp. TaxID=51671 RepID=UPI003A850FEA